MERKRLLTLIGSICLTLVLLALLSPACAKPAPTPAPAPTPKVTTWRFSSNLPGPPGEQGLETEVFKQMVSDETKGLLQLDVHYSGELGYTGAEMLRIMKDGLVESAELGAPYISQEVNWLQILDFPTIFQNYDQVVAATNAIRPKFEELVKQYNATPLAFYHHVGTGGEEGGQILYTNADIQKIEDFKGLKVRVYSNIHNDYWLKDIGMSGVFMPTSECYSAMKTGVIDGVMSGLAAVAPLKLDEVSKYAYYLTRGTASPFLMAAVANNDAFNKLPKEARDGLINAGKKYEAREWEVWRYPEKFKGQSTAAETIKYMQDRGMEVRYLPQSMYDQFRDIMLAGLKTWTGKVGPEGKEVADIVTKAMGLKY